MQYLGMPLTIMFVCAASLAYVANPILGVVMLLATGLMLTCLWSVEGGLLICLLSIPFDRLLIPNPDAAILTVQKALIFFTAVAWGLRWLVRRETLCWRSLVEQPSTILLVGFVLVSGACCFQSLDPMASLSVAFRRFSVFGLFWLIVSLIRTRPLLDRAINVLMFASIFVCLVGFYEFFLQQQFLPQDFRGSDSDLTYTPDGASRIQGLAGNSNFHAAILVMLLPYVLTRLLQVRWEWKLPWALLSGAYFFNIIATNTRQGTYGMVLVIAGMIAVNKIPYKGLLVGAVMVLSSIAILIMSADSSVSMARYTGDSGMKSVEYRLGWMMMSLEMGLQRPVFGIGTGQYLEQYMRYRRVAPTEVENRPFKNHMGIMQVWAENGGIGLTIYLAMLFAFATSLLPLLRPGAVAPDVRMLAIGVLSAHVMYVWFIGIIPVLEHEVGWIGMGFSAALRTMYDHGLLKPDGAASLHTAPTAKAELMTATA